MTAHKPAEFPRVLKRAPGDCRGILVHGDDGGTVRRLVDEAAVAVAGSRDDPFAVTVLPDERLGEDPSRLIDELQSVPMLGGTRVVVVRNAGSGLARALLVALAAGWRGSLLVAGCDALAKTSALRKLFESDPSLAAFACYEPRPEELDALIDAFEQRESLTVEPAARATLKDLVGTETAYLRNELEKLAVYALGSRSITDAMVEAACGDAAAATVGELADAVFEGDTDRAAAALRRLRDEASGGAGILAVLQAHVARLQELSVRIRPGASPAAAVQQARPPIFFKRQDSMVRQLSAWSGEHLSAAARTIAEATAAGRHLPRLDWELTDRTVLSLCLRAARLRRQTIRDDA